MDKIEKRLAALEAAQKAHGGVRLPSLAQWRQWRDGDVLGLPTWVIETLQQRCHETAIMLAAVIGDFEDK